MKLYRGLGLGMVVSFVACVAAEPPPAIEPKSDGGTGDEGGVLTEGGSPDGGAPESVVYVSTSGRDELGAGLSPDKPLKTISYALSIADTNSRGEIHVCGGQYFGKTVSISKPIIIRGAYDCPTVGAWTRQAKYEKNSKFLGSNRTQIRFGGADTGAAFLISDAGLVTLDGMDIYSAGASEVVRVRGSSTAKLSDSRIVATQTTTQGPTIGILVEGADAEIVDCEVRGGSGNATLLNPGQGQGTGSVAIAFVGASGRVANSDIYAGSGSHESESGIYTTGILADAKALGTVSVEGNRIFAEAVKTPNFIGQLTAFIGINSTGSGTLSARKNLIAGGTKIESGCRTNIFGMLLNSSIAKVAEVSDNRIDLGSVDGYPTACFSLKTSSFVKADFVNNAIVAGCTGSGASTGIGIDVAGISNIVHNTVLVRSTAGVQLRSGASGSLLNNLIVVAGPQQVSSAVLVDQCISAVQPNMFGVVEGNVTFAQAHVKVTGFAGCTPDQTTLGYFFPNNPNALNKNAMGLDVESPFKQRIGEPLISKLDTEGWLLDNCLANRDATRLALLSSKDIAGKSRNMSRPSAGAWEYAGSCTP